MMAEDDPQQREEECGTPPKRYWEATESRFDLKFSHWVEILLTLALVFVGIAQLVVYKRQASIMDEQTNISARQLDAMEIDKRPWIRASVNIEELRFTEWAGDKGINTRLIFDLKNYGESPAVNIRAWTEISPHPGNNKRAELDVRQENACNKVRVQAEDNSIGGVAIFPTESNPIKSGSGASGIYKTNEPILFSVLGCIDYTFAQTRHGQTGFRMILGRIVKNRIVGLPFIQGSPQPYEEPISRELLASGYPAKPPNVALVPASDFVFRPDDGGNYAR
jgi:hypothetical protein